MRWARAAARLVVPSWLWSRAVRRAIGGASYCHRVASALAVDIAAASHLDATPYGIPRHDARLALTTLLTTSNFMDLHVIQPLAIVS